MPLSSWHWDQMEATWELPTLLGSNRDAERASKGPGPPGMNCRLSHLSNGNEITYFSGLLWGQDNVWESTMSSSPAQHHIHTKYFQCLFWYFNTTSVKLWVPLRRSSPQGDVRTQYWLFNVLMKNEGFQLSPCSLEQFAEQFSIGFPEDK